VGFDRATRPCAARTRQLRPFTKQNVINMIIELCLHWKKEDQIFVYIRKFRMEQLQSHTVYEEEYMRKCTNIWSYMRRPLVIYNFATDPFWISLYLRKIWVSFFQCNWLQTAGSLINTNRNEELLNEYCGIRT